MKFFQDFNISKDSKIGITNLLSNITTRPGSHKGGWAKLLKCQLNHLGYKNVEILNNKNSILEYGIIIFDLGAEYSGSLNMFGGLDGKVFNRLNDIRNFKGILFSWKNELPDLSILESRRTNASTCSAFKETGLQYIGDVQRVLSTTRVFQHAYITDSLLIGDSHTPAVWTPEVGMIERRDGRTLKGMVEKGTIKKYIDLFKTDNVEIKKIHVHCGSIDIRHHICREKDPEQTIAGYLVSLVSQLHEVGYEFDKVILNHTMGIEDESRELPKTGWFRGSPFFGSWEQRNRCKLMFNEVVDDYTKGCPGWSHVKFPDYFFDKQGKLKFEVMEGGLKGSSVHISPEHYRWDLDKNESRW